jgi:hypothetical protein
MVWVHITSSSGKRSQVRKQLARMSLSNTIPEDHSCTLEVANRVVYLLNKYGFEEDE